MGLELSLLLHSIHDEPPPLPFPIHLQGGEHTLHLDPITDQPLNVHLTHFNLTRGVLFCLLNEEHRPQLLLLLRKRVELVLLVHSEHHHPVIHDPLSRLHHQQPLHKDVR